MTDAAPGPPMTDVILACATFVLLCASAVAGRTLLRRLPDQHRSAQTLAFVQTVSGLLVTFTALVLSLLITGVSADFKKAGTDLGRYAAGLIRLDTDLAAYGAATVPVRAMLRSYTAAAIASTWPGEPRPSGTYPVAEGHGQDIDAPNLGALLEDAALGIAALQPATVAQTRLQASALDHMDALRDLRWTLVDEAHSGISPPFVAMMMVWLVIVFLSFGLNAPENATAAAFIVLVSLAVAGAIFVILELDGPLDGLVTVSSESMRHALAHLDGLATAR